MQGGTKWNASEKRMGTGSVKTVLSTFMSLIQIPYFGHRCDVIVVKPRIIWLNQTSACFDSVYALRIEEGSVWCTTQNGVINVLEGVNQKSWKKRKNQIRGKKPMTTLNFLTSLYRKFVGSFVFLFSSESDCWAIWFVCMCINVGIGSLL